MSLMQAGIHAGPIVLTSGISIPNRVKTRFGNWDCYQPWLYRAAVPTNPCYDVLPAVPLYGPPIPTGDPSYDALPNLVRADPAILNAMAPTWVTMRYDYFPLEDSGALSRPSASMISGNCVNSPAFYNMKLAVISAGVRLQLAYCEVVGLVTAGAARFG